MNSCFSITAFVLHIGLQITGPLSSIVPCHTRYHLLLLVQMVDMSNLLLLVQISRCPIIPTSSSPSPNSTYPQYLSIFLFLNPKFSAILKIHLMHHQYFSKWIFFCHHILLILLGILSFFSSLFIISSL